MKVSGGGFVDTTEIAIGVINLLSRPAYEVGEELNVTIINGGDGYLYLRACGYHLIYNSDTREYLCKPPYSRTAGYQKLGPGEFTKVGHHYAPSNISELGNYTIEVVGYYSEEDFGSSIWPIHQLNASITIKVIPG